VPTGGLLGPRRRALVQSIAGQARNVERVHDRDRVGQFLAGGGLETDEPVQVSSRLPSRLVSWASAPEFGELLGKDSALVETGSSGGRTRRQIHQIVAECVA
jgi:hypothetical protein